MIKNSNLIAKLVELPEKEWVALAKKGHNLPAGRFSMRKVMKNINYSEMLKLMTEHEKQCLLIKALNVEFRISCSLFLLVVQLELYLNIITTG